MRQIRLSTVYSKIDSIPYLVVHSFKFQCKCNELGDANFQLHFNFTNRRETPYRAYRKYKRHAKSPIGENLEKNPRKNCIRAVVFRIVIDTFRCEVCVDHQEVILRK
jgi:hypothetical protein